MQWNLSWEYTAKLMCLCLMYLKSHTHTHTHTAHVPDWLAAHHHPQAARQPPAGRQVLPLQPPHHEALHYRGRRRYHLPHPREPGGQGEIPQVEMYTSLGPRFLWVFHTGEPPTLPLPLPPPPPKALVGVSHWRAWYFFHMI